MDFNIETGKPGLLLLVLVVKLQDQLNLVLKMLPPRLWWWINGWWRYAVMPLQGESVTPIFAGVPLLFKCS